MTPPQNIEQLFIALDKVVLELVELYETLKSDQINSVPYKNSWTASQLLNHITKSTVGVAQVLVVTGKVAERNPTARVDELIETFLDYSTKMKSPHEIVPDDGPFDRENVTKSLQTAFRETKQNVNKTNLNQLVEGLPLGSITKIELLHFVLYHTTRHLEQMKRICEAL